jgi:hypothetical protein
VHVLEGYPCQRTGRKGRGGGWDVVMCVRGEGNRVGMCMRARGKGWDG